MRRKELPAICPFCEASIPRPTAIEDEAVSAGIRGGSCACGAVFVFDEAGKGGGDAVLGGLRLLCGGDADRAMGLAPDVDYQLERRGYRPRTHSYEPHLRKRGALSQPKLWFFRLTTPPDAD
jgi:hypothetical protein